MSIVSSGEVLKYLGKSSTATTADLDLLQLLQPIADNAIEDFLQFKVLQATYTEYYPERHLNSLRDELVDSAPFEMVGGRAVQYGQLALDNQIIQLRNIPIRSVTSLYENPDAWDNGPPPYFPASTLLHEGPDFQVDYRAAGLSWTGEIYRISGGWYLSPYAQRTIQITYVAGFTPSEICTLMGGVRYASLIACAKLFLEAEAMRPNPLTGTCGGPLTSESVNGYSASFDAESVRNNFGWNYILPMAAMRHLERYLNYNNICG